MAVLNALMARVMGSVRPASSAMPAAIYQVMLPHERYHIALRQHPAVLGGPLLVAVGGFLGVVVTDQLLPPDSYYLAVTIWAIWLAILLWLSIRIAGWMGSYLVLSSLRLFVVSGAFVKTVQYLPLSTISDVSFSRSPAGRFLDYGKFIVEIGGADRVLVPFDYVPYPEEVSVEIRAIIFSGQSATAESFAEEGEPSAEN
jgi:hypothetical protein